MANTRPNLGPDLNTDKPKNVVLIGSTGHGKSSFGNFLLNLGEHDTFATSDLMDTCTKGIQIAQVAPFYKLPPLNVIDTPGLNDENDLPQMLNVARGLRELGDIAAVILCLSWSTRADVNFIATVEYYRRLLAPVFISRNIILICTKMSNDTYIDYISSQKLEGIIEDRRKVTSKALDVEVDICELVDSVIPRKKREKVMKTWDEMKSKSRAKPKGEKPAGTKPNIWISSLLTRERLFRVLYAFSDVDIREHKFPLPPPLETRRKAKLAMLMELSNELVKAVEVENKARGSVLEQVKNLEDAMQQKADRLAMLHQKLQNLRGTQKTESIYKHGDEIIHFNKIKDQTLFVPVDKYEIKDNSWHCLWEQKKFENGKITLDIIPHIVTLTRHAAGDDDDKQRWFIMLWAEYSGYDSHPDQISNLEKACADLKMEIQVLQSKLSEERKKSQQFDDKLDKHQERQQHIHNDLQTLNHEHFDLGEVMDVVNLIQQRSQ